MSTRLKDQTIEVIDKYLRQLDTYSIEQLCMQPAEGSWSVGQVYIHLWMSAKGFFFKNASQCISRQDCDTRQGKNWRGKVVFALGFMPPVKVKMPEKLAVQPYQPESKEQLVSRLNELKAQCEEAILLLHDADLNNKTRHPLLGYLNAREWLALNRMHFRHHELQISRIKRHFGW
jgi:hypothetical protein